MVALVLVVVGFVWVAMIGQFWMWVVVVECKFFVVVVDFW